MGMETIVLIGLVTGIAVISLVFTLAVARGQKQLKGEIDTPIDKSVKQNVYLRNPIFLAYVIFFVLTILTIIFFAKGANW